MQRFDRKARFLLICHPLSCEDVMLGFVYATVLYSSNLQQCSNLSGVVGWILHCTSRFTVWLLVAGDAVQVSSHCYQCTLVQW